MGAGGLKASVSKRRPFKIEIFVAEGLPDGLRLVKKSNWIGQGIVCPRGRYSEAKKRPEFSRSGVYLLVGQDGEQLPKYLEARLLELAKSCERATLQNAVKSHRPGLSEADQAEMEGYLDELRSLLPVLGPFFERDETPAKDRKDYHVKGPGCKATGFETNTGFTVQEGSLAREPTVLSMKKKAPGYYHQRQDLIKDKVLEKTADAYRFTKDWLFGSPSAAAAVCLGRPANGLTEWKDGSGATLKANREKATQD